MYGPKETVIMHKSVAPLAKVGHIYQAHDGHWLFKALLAAKSHQEHISNIDYFVWRFCVNYIPLNQVTHQIAYPILCCDHAVNLAFGIALFFWLFDVPTGYHQLAVAPESQEKLAFQGTDIIKWTYTVMSSGPTNGPATYIQMIHDLNSAWKDLTAWSDINVNDNTNMNNIVDDIFNWAISFDSALKYMECQLQICKAYHLTLSLKKSCFFLKCFKFVGANVLPDGNCPAMSKHQLLDHWPTPEFVRDIASFIGSVQFYSAFILYFEVRAKPLQEIMQHEYTLHVGDLWTPAATAAFDELRHCILCYPCLCHFNHRKLTVLRTEFLSQGFSYVVCQPDDNDAFLQLIAQYMSRNGFGFMTSTSKGTLHPVAFGSWQTCGNEPHLHLYLGEIFAGDWAMGKCCHMLFGHCFIWVTDCYAAQFLLSYDCGNQAVLCLQMRIIGWDVDIIHRAHYYLTNTNYWSRLNFDLYYDPTFKDYIKLVSTLRLQSMSPSDLPLLPRNMPYYRGPQIKVNPPTLAADNEEHQRLLACSMLHSHSEISPHLSDRSVQFENFDHPLHHNPSHCIQ